MTLTAKLSSRCHRKHKCKKDAGLANEISYTFGVNTNIRYEVNKWRKEENLGLGKEFKMTVLEYKVSENQKTYDMLPEETQARLFITRMRSNKNYITHT